MMFDKIKKRTQWHMFLGIINCIIYFSFLLGLSSCVGEKAPECSELIEQRFIFTEQEIESFNIVSEKPQFVLKSETIHIQGESVEIPEYEYVISPPLSGFINNLKVKAGDRVQKGQLLAILNHIDYLELKMEFLEAKNDFEFYRKNYARQGELAIEQATPLKEMEQAEVLYKQAELKLMGLKAKLKLIGINSDELSQNSLNDFSYLFASESGIVQEIEIVKGQYCTDHDVICRISKANQNFFRFIVDEEVGKALSVNDTVFVSIKDIKSEPFLLSSIEKSDAGWLVLVENYTGKAFSNSVKVYGDFIQLKKFYRVPSKSLINNNMLLIANNKSEINVKKVTSSYSEKEDVLIEYFELKSNEEIINDGYKVLLTKICP